jgi:hypothetical protein
VVGELIEGVTGGVLVWYLYSTRTLWNNLKSKVKKMKKKIRKTLNKYVNKSRGLVSKNKMTIVSTVAGLAVSSVCLILSAGNTI